MITLTREYNPLVQLWSRLRLIEYLRSLPEDKPESKGEREGGWEGERGGGGRERARGEGEGGKKGEDVIILVFSRCLQSSSASCQCYVAVQHCPPCTLRSSYASSSVLLSH